jgi:hypothetical protein
VDADARAGADAGVGFDGAPHEMARTRARDAVVIDAI